MECSSHLKGSKVDTGSRSFVVVAASVYELQGWADALCDCLPEGVVDNSVKELLTIDEEIAKRI